MTIEYDDTTKRWTLGELTGGLLHSLLKGIQATVKGVQALSLTSEEAAEVVERFREKICELTPNNSINDTINSTNG